VGRSISSLREFGLGPEKFEIVWRQGGELGGATAGVLHGGKAGAEFGVAAAQG
jgi:hypothetical protein